MILKRNPAPRWVHKRIKELYELTITIAVNSREKYMAEKSEENRQKYAFAIGEVSSLEAVMDLLFIPYDDNGKIYELED